MTEIDQLKVQLAAVEKERDEAERKIPTTADAMAHFSLLNKLEEARQQLAAVTKERDGLSDIVKGMNVERLALLAQLNERDENSIMTERMLEAYEQERDLAQRQVAEYREALEPFANLDAQAFASPESRDRVGFTAFVKVAWIDAARHALSPSCGSHMIDARGLEATKGILNWVIDYIGTLEPTISPGTLRFITTVRSELARLTALMEGKR